MTEKKEILDYLRNRQKAAEIEAKVEGINIWVLLGAMAILIWQLSGTYGTKFWVDPIACIRAATLASAMFLLALFGSRTRRGSNEFRYSSTSFTENDSPLLALLLGVLVAGPLLLLQYFTGPNLGALLLAVPGILIVVQGILALARTAKPQLLSRHGFPWPSLTFTSAQSLATQVLYAGLAVYVIWSQLNFLRLSPAIKSVDDLRTFVLVAALYGIACLSIFKKIRTYRLSWTYALETQLLLDSVSVEDALRRIESRSLGPRVQDVLERHFDEIERKFDALIGIQLAIRNASSFSETPAAHLDSKAADTASLKCRALESLTPLDNDIEAITNYLKNFRLLVASSQRYQFSSIFQSLDSRVEAYRIRLQAIRDDIKGGTEV